MTERLPLRAFPPLLGLLGCGQETGVVSDCPGLVINEIYAANESDPFPPGEPGSGCGEPDWIELLNTGRHPVDLSAYSITPTLVVDGVPLGGDRGEPVWLEPGEHIVVLALPYEVPEGECDPGWPPQWLFMGVDLDRDNGRVILRSPRGRACDDIFYPDQHVDLSWSRLPDGGEGCAMAEPTPNAPNGGAISAERYPCSL